MIEDIDKSTAPSKWVKRGAQPEYKPDQPDPVIKSARLARLIRESSDPIEKARLEKEFRQHEEEFNSINPGDDIIDLADVYREIVELSVPEDARDTAITTLPNKVKSQDDWRLLHSSLVTIKRRTSGWLGKSRKFARQNWGAKFLREEENQMELALGIESKSEDDKPQVIYLDKLRKLSVGVTKWFAESKDEREGWTEEQREEAKGYMESISKAIS